VRGHNQYKISRSGRTTVYREGAEPGAAPARPGNNPMRDDPSDCPRKFRHGNGFADHALDRVAAGPHTQITWRALPAECGDATLE
jgi:hypothetical protein